MIVEREHTPWLEKAGEGTFLASIILGAISIGELNDPKLWYGPLITLIASVMLLPISALEIYVGSKVKIDLSGLFLGSPQ